MFLQLWSQGQGLVWLPLLRPCLSFPQEFWLSSYFPFHIWNLLHMDNYLCQGCYGGLCRVLFSCLKTEKKEHSHDRVNSPGKHLKGFVSLMLITTLEQTSGTRRFASAHSRMKGNGTAWCHVGTADLRNMAACHILMWGFHERGFRVTWLKGEPLVSLLEKIRTFMTPLRDINRNKCGDWGLIEVQKG